MPLQRTRCASSPRTVHRERILNERGVLIFFQGVLSHTLCSSRHEKKLVCPASVTTKQQSCRCRYSSLYRRAAPRTLSILPAQKGAHSVSKIFRDFVSKVSYPDGLMETRIKRLDNPVIPVEAMMLHDGLFCVRGGHDVRVCQPAPGHSWSGIT